MIEQFTQLTDKPERDCIYTILSHMDLGLCVDIGAAAGQITKRLRLCGGPTTNVVAFEPFPGNYPYFYESTKGLDNITLIKKAVSDQPGIAEFFVPSVVKGKEKGWEQFQGYSSTGFLSSAAPAPLSNTLLERKLRLLLRHVAYFLGKHEKPQKVEVEMTTLDREFSDKKIDFIKIDVQGAEEQVLRGAEKLLKDNLIHLMYIEWAGEREVLEILKKYNFIVYDSTYLIGPRGKDVRPFEEIGFKLLQETNLSTGKVAYDMVLKSDGVSAIEAIQQVSKKGLGWVQTDLIAIHPAVQDKFMEAVKAYNLDDQPENQ